MATAISPAHQWMEKATIWSTTIAIVIGTTPAMSHDVGTSIAAIRACRSEAPSAAALPRRNSENALATVFHCSASDVRLENTITAVPPHNPQRGG